MGAAKTKAWINARIATMDPRVDGPYGALPGHADAGYEIANKTADECGLDLPSIRR